MIDDCDDGVGKYGKELTDGSAVKALCKDLSFQFRLVDGVFPLTL